MKPFHVTVRTWSPWGFKDTKETKLEFASLSEANAAKAALSLVSHGIFVESKYHAPLNNFQPIHQNGPDFQEAKRH